MPTDDKKIREMLASVQSHAPDAHLPVKEERFHTESVSGHGHTTADGLAVSQTLKGRDNSETRSETKEVETDNAGHRTGRLPPPRNPGVDQPSDTLRRRSKWSMPAPVFDGPSVIARS